MVRSIGLDVVCDYELLSWYSPFARNSSIDNKASIAQCNDINNFNGIYPHLLQLEPLAPATHPIITNAYPTANTVNISFTYNDKQIAEYHSLGLNSLLEILGPDAAVQFERCQSVESNEETALDLNGAYGFKVDWIDRATGSRLGQKCFDAKSVEKNQYYSVSVTQLAPYSGYSFTVTAFVVRALQSLNVVPVAYVVGPTSRPVSLTTLTDVPIGPVSGVKFTDIEARRAVLQWESGDNSHGEIVLYRVQVNTRGQLLELETTETNIDITSLLPKTKLDARVLHATSAGFGSSWSPVVEAMTCPVFTRWSKEFVNNSCLPVAGNYLDEFGSVRSCSEITAQYSDALENGCLSDKLDVRSLPLNRGFWRASLTTSVVYPCPVPQFCQGRNSSIESPDDYCLDNHAGVFCYTCTEGFVATLNGCEVCSSEREEQAAGVIVLYAILYIILVLMFIGKITFSSHIWKQLTLNRRKRKTQRSSLIQNDQPGSFFWSSIERRLSTAKLKRAAVAAVVQENSASKGRTAKVRILFGFLQVFFAFKQTFEIRQGEDGGVIVFLEFMSNVDFVSVLASFDVRCLYNFTPYGELLISTTLPLLLIVIIVLVSWGLSRLFITLKKEVWREFLWCILSFLFLIYPSVSRTILQTFWCIEFNDVIDPVLRSDYKTKCVSSLERDVWLTYASLMVIVYPIGVVLLYSSLLYYYHHVIVKPNKVEKDIKSLAKISFLISPYKPSCYWFETYELGRKLVQTSLVGFLIGVPQANGPTVLALISQNLCILALGILIYTKPYQHDSDLVFAVVSLTLLLITTQFTVVDPYSKTESIDIGEMEFLLLLEILFFFFFVALDIHDVYLSKCISCRKPSSDQPESESTVERLVAQGETFQVVLADDGTTSPVSLPFEERKDG